MESHHRSLPRRLLAAALDREEQGLPQPQPIPIPPPILGSKNHPSSIPPDTPPTTLIPPTDKLLAFRALTGINTLPPTHSNPRPAPNIGIYARVLSAEHSAAQRHRFFSLLINTCLGIQMVVAAGLTALGAASGPHSAVTAFGAINTIMAGVLTYLKGSGLPDKVKCVQDQWRGVREYIEQRERELCLVGCGLDVHEEVRVVEEMYEGVKREVEAMRSGGRRDGGRRERWPGSGRERMMEKN